MELETITFIIPLLYQLPLTPDSTTCLWGTILESDDSLSHNLTILGDKGIEDVIKCMAVGA